MVHRPPHSKCVGRLGVCVVDSVGEGRSAQPHSLSSSVRSSKGSICYEQINITSELEGLGYNAGQVW